MESLFTFIMEYLGGTYITQIMSVDLESAINEWINNLDSNQIDGLTLKDKNNLIKNRMFLEPILIEGCKNVWNIDTVINKKNQIAIINIVKTVF